MNYTQRVFIEWNQIKKEYTPCESSFTKLKQAKLIYGSRIQVCDYRGHTYCLGKDKSGWRSLYETLLSCTLRILVLAPLSYSNCKGEKKVACKKCFVIFVRHGLDMQPRLALNLQSSCLGHLNARITGIYHHTQPQKKFSIKGKRQLIV
jgi:hypothetical protein